MRSTPPRSALNPDVVHEELRDEAKRAYKDGITTPWRFDEETKSVKTGLNRREAVTVVDTLHTSYAAFYRDRLFTALRDVWDRGDDDAAIAARRNRSITATIARMSILGHHHKDPSQPHLCEPPQAI